MHRSTWMNPKRLPLLLLMAVGVHMNANVADAQGQKKFQNLKVLEDNGKSLQSGMKSISKGLGVKCSACHVKGDFASDEMSSKSAARKFFGTSLSTQDRGRRQAALKTLLVAVKKESARDPGSVWKGLEQFKLKKGRTRGPSSAPH